MIEELTESQISTFPSYVEKWTSIGLATEEEQDEEAVRRVLAKIYRNGGLEPPSTIEFCGSPQAGAKEISKSQDNVWEKVWKKVGDKVLEKVEENVTENVTKKVEEKVLEKVWGEIGFKIRNKVYEKKTHIPSRLWGQHDADFCARYDFFRNELGLVEETELWVPFIELAKISGWVWPFARSAVVTPKPRFLNLDHKFGPLVEYPDGWTVGGENNFLRDMRSLRECSNESASIEFLREFKYQNPEHLEEFFLWARGVLEAKNFQIARDYIK